MTRIGAEPQKIPVIGATAYQLETVQESCRQAGFNQLMAKPMTLEALKSVLLKFAKTRVRYRTIKDDTYLT